MLLIRWELMCWAAIGSSPRSIAASLAVSSTTSASLETTTAALESSSTAAVYIVRVVVGTVPVRGAVLPIVSAIMLIAGTKFRGGGIRSSSAVGAKVPAAVTASSPIGAATASAAPMGTTSGFIALIIVLVLFALALLLGEFFIGVGFLDFQPFRQLVDGDVLDSIVEAVVKVFSPRSGGENEFLQMILGNIVIVDRG